MIEFNRIPGYSNYLAGSDGSIKKGDKFLRLSSDPVGYMRVRVKDDNGKSVVRYVHRLICSAFHPNPYSKSDVNHKNAIKSDNRAENLEWSTRQENMAHAKRNNLYNPNKGENNQNTKLSNRDVKSIVTMCREGMSHASVSSMFGVNPVTVTLIMNGKTWGHLTGIKYEKKTNRSKNLGRKDIDYIKEQYLNGVTITQIAEDTGYSTTAIFKKLKDTPFYNKKKGIITDEMIDKMLEMKETGMTNIAIAEQFEVSSSYVSRLIGKSSKFEKFTPIPGHPNYVLGSGGTIKHCPPIDWRKNLESQGSGTVVKPYNGVVVLDGNPIKVAKVKKLVQSVTSIL